MPHRTYLIGILNRSKAQAPMDENVDLLRMDWSLDGRLKSVGLIGEISFTEEDLHAMGRCLKDCLDSRGPGPATAYLEYSGARVVACFLVHLGLREYRQAHFWGPVTRALGQELAPNLQRRWGGMVEQVLRDYEMEPFYDPSEPDGQRYVTPILGHGGIPDYCLNDFFDKLLMPVARGELPYDGDVGQLLEQWRDRASDYQTADKPIRRFMQHG